MISRKKALRGLIRAEPCSPMKRGKNEDSPSHLIECKFIHSICPVFQADPCKHICNGQRRSSSWEGSISISQSFRHPRIELGRSFFLSYPGKPDQPTATWAGRWGTLWRRLLFLYLYETDVLSKFISSKRSMNKGTFIILWDLLLSFAKSLSDYEFRPLLSWAVSIRSS